MESKREANRRRATDIPPKYKDLSLSDFKLDFYGKDKHIGSSVKKCLSGYIKDFGIESRGLYLFGKTKGTGKTRGACIVLNELSHNGYAVKFTTSGQLLQSIKDSWSDKANGERSVIDDLTNTDILLIDDFGVESVTDWRQEQFYNIINERYITQRPTIFTSNFDLAELDKNGYDTRITSRIKESCIMLPFPGSSVRDVLASDQMEIKEWLS